MKWPAAKLPVSKRYWQFEWRASRQRTPDEQWTLPVVNITKDEGVEVAQTYRAKRPPLLASMSRGGWRQRLTCHCYARSALILS